MKSPLLMAPLGTYTGWNVTTSGLFKGQMCGPPLARRPSAGSFRSRKRKPSARASGDPRLSLEERYHEHDGYVQAVKPPPIRSCATAICWPTTQSA